MTDIVDPQMVPAMPPAPLPTDPPQVFDDKAVALAQGYEPTIDGMNKSAKDTNQNATAAKEYALLSKSSWDSVSAGVTDVHSALAAIKAGPVASVNGRTGVVSGLVDTATVLPSSINLGSIKTSGFYRLGTQKAGPYDVSQGQMIVSSNGNVIWQQITAFDNSYVLTRSGWADGNSWSPFRVAFHDGYVVERMNILRSVSGAIKPNPADGSICWIEPNGNCSITPAAPRGPGDQLTLRLMQRGSYSFTLGSNILLRPGVTLQPLVNGQMRSLVLTGLFDGDARWLAYDAGVHSI